MVSSKRESFLHALHSCVYGFMDIFLHSFQFIGIVCGKEYVRGLFKILLSISDVIEKRLFASKEKSSHME